MGSQKEIEWRNTYAHKLSAVNMMILLGQCLDSQEPDTLTGFE